MIPFPFNENRFSFPAADHLLVGQLWINPKSDRSLLLCLKVTQCSMSAAVQHMISTHPSYANRTIASTLKMQIRTVQHLRTQLNESYDPSVGYGYGLWCGFKRGPHHATSHLRSRLQSQHQSLHGCAEECGYPLVQSGILWLPTSPKRPRLGFRRSATTLYPFLTAPPPESAGLLHLVILREHHQHDLPQHQSQPDRLHPPSIHWVPAGACEKGMLSVRDPYRGVDWGWRWLHWIDVSSTT